ncbi:MAG TPA: GFA family protein [Candidatus Binatus sp.]|nr:GFA family protein [Candidatus Binatus sp.]
MSERFGGSCLCGAVAFEATGGQEFRYCHCSRCRKARGSAFAANMFVQPDDFRWIRGEDQVVKYRMPSAARFGNWFCGTCGSPVPRDVPALKVVLIPAGSLDHDPGVRPGYHIFVGSKAPWEEIADDLPRHAEYPKTK